MINMAKWSENPNRIEENNTQIITSIVNAPTIGLDPRLCMSFMASDLRYELTHNEHLSTKEMRKWWLERSDAQIESIGYYVLGGDDIWRAFIQEVSHAMEIVRKQIEGTSDE